MRAARRWLTGLRSLAPLGLRVARSLPGSAALVIGFGLLVARAHAAGVPAFAPPALAAGAPSGTMGLGQVTLALGAVLLAIFGFAWLARRLRGVGRRPGSAIEVLGDVALGPKERAVLLRIGRARLLVGVAPGAVQTLHVFGAEADEQPLAAESRTLAAAAGAAEAAPGTSPVAPGRPTFRALLARSLGR